jgi:hypothetical protein
VTQYPAPFLARFSAKLSLLQRDVAKLKTRTAGIDSGFPLMMLPGVIDPSFTTGSPMVFVNGSTTLSGPFQNLASYTPVAGDAVLLAPVGAMQAYVILGKTVGTGTSLVVPPT